MCQAYTCTQPLVLVLVPVLVRTGFATSRSLPNILARESRESVALSTFFPAQWMACWTPIMRHGLPAPETVHNR